MTKIRVLKLHHQILHVRAANEICFERVTEKQYSRLSPSKPKVHSYCLLPVKFHEEFATDNPRNNQ